MYNYKKSIEVQIGGLSSPGLMVTLIHNLQRNKHDVSIKQQTSKGPPAEHKRILSLATRVLAMFGQALSAPDKAGDCSFIDAPRTYGLN